MRAEGRRKRLLFAAFDNWVSRAYLLVFAALMVWVIVDTDVVVHPDASFAGVWPFFLTLPTSLLLLQLPDLDGWGLLAGLTVAALVNATLLGLLVRVVRRPGAGAPGRGRAPGGEVAAGPSGPRGVRGRDGCPGAHSPTTAAGSGSGVPGAPTATLGSSAGRLRSSRP